MKRFLINLLTVTAVLAFVGRAPAQERGATARVNQSAAANDVRLFPLEDLRPGMKGIARTVFAGSEPQEFGVEILGVLPGFPGPHQSGIIARLSGSNVEKTSVFAGMS